MYQNSSSERGKEEQAFESNPNCQPRTSQVCKDETKVERRDEKVLLISCQINLSLPLVLRRVCRFIYCRVYSRKVTCCLS